MDEDISNPEHIQIDSIGLVGNYKYKKIQIINNKVYLDKNIWPIMLSNIYTYKKNKFSTLMPRDYLNTVYNYYRFQLLSDYAKFFKSVFITIGATLFSHTHYHLGGNFNVASFDLGTTIFKSKQIVLLHKLIFGLYKNLFFGCYRYQSIYDAEFVFCLGGELSFMLRILEKNIYKLRFYFLLRYWYSFLSFSKKQPLMFFPLFNKISFRKYEHFTRSIKDRYGFSLYPIFCISVDIH